MHPAAVANCTELATAHAQGCLSMYTCRSLTALGLHTQRPHSRGQSCHLTGQPGHQGIWLAFAFTLPTKALGWGIPACSSINGVKKERKACVNVTSLDTYLGMLFATGPSWRPFCEGCTQHCSCHTITGRTACLGCWNPEYALAGSAV